jgi:PAS domain S-box-containing protein
MTFISSWKFSSERGRWDARALGALVAAALAVATWTAMDPPTGLRARLGVGPGVTGPLAGGLVGLASGTDGNGDVGRLVEKIQRFEAGEDVDFTSECDDDVGRLYDAVGSLATTVEAHEREQRTAEEYRQELYRITSNTDLESEAKIRRLLELGCERLDVENGLVTRIDQERDGYEIETVAGGDFVEEGAVTDLVETFCRNTIRSDDILGIFNAWEEGFEEDPGYTVWNINCYIGGKLELEGDLYGTVCFVDPEPRATEFVHDEKAFVNLVTRWISHELTQREHVADLLLRDRALVAAPVGVTITDPSQEDNPLIYANERFQELTGYPTEAILGRNCRFLQDEGTADEPVAEMREAIDAEEPVTTELRNYRSDGTEFWNRVSISPVANDVGEVTNFVGFQEDITERVEHERGLRETKGRLELALEGTDTGIWEWDLETDELQWNETLEALVGLDPGGFDGTYDASYYETQLVRAVESVLSPLDWDRAGIKRELAESQETNLTSWG